MQSKATTFDALEDLLGSKDGSTEHEAVAASLQEALKTLAEEVSTKFARKRMSFLVIAGLLHVDFLFRSLQVRAVGEQLVNVGGSHGWGPGNLTDQQVWLGNFYDSMMNVCCLPMCSSLAREHTERLVYSADRM